MNEEAIWELAGEGGMGALTVERLAEKTGKGVRELTSLYPDPIYMVITLVEKIHTQAMTMPATSLSVQDHLTDVVMSHLDTGLEHREAIRRLWDDLVTMPLSLLALRPHLMKITTHILKECGVELDDLWAPLRLRAYLGLFLYVLYIWVHDESKQQEQTLVTLDKGLKTLGELPW